MTNKTERYFVVSESELEDAIIDAQLSSLNSEDEYLQDVAKRSKAACRARPFEKYQAVVEAAESYLGMWVEKDDPRDRDLRDALAALQEDKE